MQHESIQSIHESILFHNTFAEDGVCDFLVYFLLLYLLAYTVRYNATINR